MPTTPILTRRAALLALLLALLSGGGAGCDEDARSGSRGQAEERDAGADDAGADDAGADDAANNAPPCTPAAEVCDGEDNDCDGATDEGVTRACGVAVGACELGEERCEAGSWGACDAPLLPGVEAEVCDGADNNCDGDTDEGCDCVNGAERSCLQGLCGGVERCDAGAWGGCVPEEPPAPQETCDGEDRDCDGAVDEGCACSGVETQGCLVGLCAGMQVCAGGAWADCAPIGPPGPEACNGEDDDCDGSVDEGVVRVCGSAEGSCQEGEERCDGGVWGECQGDVPPRPEVCDGEDSDCNGRVDDVSAGTGEALSTFPPGTEAAEWLDGARVATYERAAFLPYVKYVRAQTGEVEATSPALAPSGQVTGGTLVSADGIVGLLLGVRVSGGTYISWRLIQLDSQAQPLTETELLVSERADAGASLTAQGDYFVAAVTDRYDSGAEGPAQLIWVRRVSGAIAGRHLLPSYKSVGVYGHSAGVWVRGAVRMGLGEAVPSSYAAASPDEAPRLIPDAVGDGERCLIAAPTPEGFAALSTRRVYNTPNRLYDTFVSLQNASPEGRPLGPPRVIAVEPGNVSLNCYSQQLKLAPFGEGFLATWAPLGTSQLGYVNPQGALEASATGWLPAEVSPLALRVDSAQQVGLVQRRSTGGVSVTFHEGFPLACGVPAWEPLSAGASCAPGAQDRCPRGTWCAPTRRRCVAAEAPILTQLQITARPSPSLLTLAIQGRHVFQGIASFEVTRLDADQQALSTVTSRVDSFSNPITLTWSDTAFIAAGLQAFAPEGTAALSIVAVDTLGYRSAPLTITIEE